MHLGHAGSLVVQEIPYSDNITSSDTDHKSLILSEFEDPSRRKVFSQHVE